MSYILGALKKAERERRREQPEPLADWDQTAWDDPTPGTLTGPWLLWLVSLTLVIVLALFGWIAYRVLNSVPTPAAVPAEAVAIPPVAQRQPSVVAGPETDSSLSATEAENPAVANEDSGAAMPALPEVSGHIFFTQGSHLNRVFAQDSAFREGDFINGYRVEQILQNELLLSRDGEEFRISLKR